MRLLQFSDHEALYAAAADRFVHLAGAAIRTRGRFVVLLSGGSTPVPLYRRLCIDPWRSCIDWSRLLIGWGDERCVPPEHPASNYHVAKDALLAHVPLPDQQVIRIRGELDPSQEASAYGERLRSAMGSSDDAVIDLTLLGLGADGHTASLFPGDPALNVEEGVFVPVHRPQETPPWRITASLPLLNASREILFLVTGKEKAHALAAVRAGSDLPAAQICPSSGKTAWMADRTACAGRTV
jgi:6-phosphogluconolactonase